MSQTFSITLGFNGSMFYSIDVIIVLIALPNDGLWPSSHSHPLEDSSAKWDIDSSWQGYLEVPCQIPKGHDSLLL